jgi:hypothetical protein
VGALLLETWQAGRKKPHSGLAAFACGAAPCICLALKSKKGDSLMIAALIFAGSGPMLVLTTFDSLDSPGFTQRLEARGISKFIAFKVPIDLVQTRYGARFSTILGDLSQTDDLRIMDIDGHHVFSNFSFDEMGPPVYSKTNVKNDIVESELVWGKMDEYGKLLESSYLPMVGSQIVPPISFASKGSSTLIHFKINADGAIFKGSPQELDGRKLLLYALSSPALGRTDTIVPARTWRFDQKGGWKCE